MGNKNVRSPYNKVPQFLSVDNNVTEVEFEILKSQQMDFNPTVKVLNDENQCLKTNHDHKQILSIGLIDKIEWTTLHLSYEGVGDSGASQVANLLHHNYTLTTLDLYGNKISDSGASQIFKSLQHNYTLTTLDLGGNEIGDSGVSQIVNSLQHNSTLKTLLLSKNEIGDSGASQIAKSLHHNSTLTCLRLSDNKIGDEGAKTFSLALKTNITLLALDLAFNKIAQIMATDINNYILRNSTINGEVIKSHCPELLSHLEKLSNTLNLECHVACNYHQCHTLYAHQTQFHLHKAIIAVKAPRLLNLKELDIEPTLFQKVVKVIYTNIPLNFKKLQSSQIIQLVHLCRLIDFIDLIPFCQHALLASLRNDNVFDLAVECYLLNLTDELNCIAWFVGKKRLSPPPAVVMKLASHPTLLSLLQSQAANITLPQLSPQLRPLGEIMEELHSQKMYTDFTINFKNTLIIVHKFVLSPRWPYFTNIMLKNQLSTVHYSPMPLDTFCKLIQYFYVGTKYLTLRDCGWILFLSEFYLLHDERSLLQYCDHMVNFHIYLNWPSALQLAIEIDNNEIEQKVISMISSSIQPQRIVSLCLSFVKEQQRRIQEQQKAFQEQQMILNNITTYLDTVESLYNRGS